MGKTAGGAVWLDPNKTSPFDFYQYWRNVDDADVINFIKKLTFLSLEEIKPMEAWEGAKLNEAKELLAFEMTKLVHSEEDSKKAQEASKALFAGGADDSNMPTTEIDPTKLTDGVINVTDLMLECDLVPSRSEVRRLVQQGGLTISDKKVDDLNLTISLDDLKEGVIIKKGKKKFHKALVK